MVDAKTVTDLKYYWSKIQAGTFDQDTVKNILLAGRELAPPKSIVRDLGDLVAHTTRNRGYSHRHINSFSTKIHRNKDATKLVIDFAMPLDAHRFPLYLGKIFQEALGLTCDEIVSVLNSHDNDTDIIVCIFSLMHYVELQFPDKRSYTLKMTGSTSNPSCLSIVAFGDLRKSAIAISLIDFQEYLGSGLSGNLEDLRDIRALRDSSGKLMLMEV
ncbi:MAG: hypothetical protein AB3N64_08440 [Puniceicoccaceae bacterium]